MFIRYFSERRLISILSLIKIKSFLPTRQFSINLQKNIFRVVKKYAYISGRNYFIQVIDCPNPNSLKFIPGVEVSGIKEPIYFPNKDECSRSNLAKKLFELKGVESVMLGLDYITISKSDEDDWKLIKPHIFSAITDFYNSNQPILNEDISKEAQEYDTEIVSRIKELLETKISPIVQEDGGNIVYDSFDEVSGVLKVKLQGSCTNCPSSSVTLKAGVANMMKFYVPEVTDVEEVKDEMSDESDRIFKILEKRLKKIKNIEDVNENEK